MKILPFFYIYYFIEKLKIIFDFDTLVVMVVGYSITWKFLRINRDIIKVWRGCKSEAMYPISVKSFTFQKQNIIILIYVL